MNQSTQPGPTGVTLNIHTQLHTHIIDWFGGAVQVSKIHQTFFNQQHYKVLRSIDNNNRTIRHFTSLKCLKFNRLSIQQQSNPTEIQGAGPEEFTRPAERRRKFRLALSQWLHTPMASYGLWGNAAFRRSTLMNSHQKRATSRAAGRFLRFHRAVRAAAGLLGRAARLRGRGGRHPCGEPE